VNLDGKGKKSSKGKVSFFILMFFYETFLGRSIKKGFRILSKLKAIQRKERGKEEIFYDFCILWIVCKNPGKSDKRTLGKSPCGVIREFPGAGYTKAGISKNNGRG